MSKLHVIPLSPLLGARIAGIRPEPPIWAQRGGAIAGADARPSTPCISRPDFWTPTPKRVLSTFGPVVGPRIAGPRHVVLAFEADNSAPFHCDYSFTHAPLPFVSLYGLEVRGGVAPTAFVDCVAACRELPARLRARIVGRNVLHASDIVGVGQRSSGSLRGDATRAPANVRSALHPAILPHPATGDEVLFINANLSVAVDGLSRPESDGLLAEIFAFLYAPERIYEHRWREGELLIFDNLAVQHTRMRGPARKLRRMIVSSEPLERLLG